MTQPTTPRSGDLYNFVQRQSGWSGPQSLKTARDSVFIGLSLKSRTTSTPPGSGTNGDAFYLPVSPAPTGVWSGQGGKIAAYFTEKPEANAPTTGYTPSSGYMFYTVPRGLQAVVQDEGDAQVYYNGTTMASLSTPAVFNYKTAADLATTGPITLSGEQTVDGTLTSASRVLVKDQAAAATNGLYTSGAGAWTRTADADTSAELPSGAIVPVTGGTANGGTVWMLTTNNPITLGTTPLVFEVVSGIVPYDTEATPFTLVERDNIGGFRARGVTLYDHQVGMSTTPALVIDSSYGGGGIVIQGTGTSGLFVSQGGGNLGAQFYSGIYIGQTSVPAIQIDNYSGNAYGILVAQNPAAGGSGEGFYSAIDFGGTGTHDGNAFHAEDYGTGGTYTGYAYKVSKSGTKGAWKFDGSLGLGAAPIWPLDLTVPATAASAVAYGARLQQTLSAAANSDTLTALYINPTFDDASHTGVAHFLAKFASAGTLKASIAENGKYSAPASGSIVAIQILTSSGDFVTGPYTTIADVYLWGGGAQGGGVTSNGSEANAASGGAAGSKCYRRYSVLPSHTYASAFTKGAGGTGATAGNNPGTDGGNSTFNDGTTTITAKGGKGGNPATGWTHSPIRQVIGGLSQVSTGGDLNGIGENGFTGIGACGSSADGNVGGAGGSSEWGSGGKPNIATGVGQQAGNAGTGKAAGGSGAVSYAGSSSVAGGAGTDGFAIIVEIA